jgi:hypothetical protein
LTLLPVQRSAAALRPMMDCGLAPGETNESRRRGRLKGFADSFNPFSEVVWKHRPFYPEEVFVVLNGLMRLVHGEALQYQLYPPGHCPGYWEAAMENAKAINEQVDVIAATIRERLSRARVA